MNYQKKGQVLHYHLVLQIILKVLRENLLCLEVEPLNIKTANSGLWKSAIVGISYLSFLFVGRANMKVEKNELWFAHAHTFSSHKRTYVVQAYNHKCAVF